MATPPGSKTARLTVGSEKPSPPPPLPPPPPQPPPPPSPPPQSRQARKICKTAYDQRDDATLCTPPRMPSLWLRGARFAGPPWMKTARLTAGKTVTLLTSLSFPIETPAKEREGCSRMTELSPTAPGLVGLRELAADQAVLGVRRASRGAGAGRAGAATPPATTWTALEQDGPDHLGL